MGALFQSQRVGGNAFFGFIYGEGVVTPPFEGDGENPVIPGLLTISDVNAYGFTVSWNAGTDNVGVAGYEVSADTGSPAYSLAGTALSKVVAGLTPETLYTVRVRAFDASNNRSIALTTTVMTSVQPVGARIAHINRQSSELVVEALSVLSPSASTIDYVKNAAQELVLFNKGSTNVTVTLKGSKATVANVKGAITKVVDLSLGLAITVPPGQFTMMALSAADAYLKGDVTIMASVGGAVYAGVLQ